MPDLADAIRVILRRHKVFPHYLGTARGGARRYAVFSDGIQSGEPLPHADAQQAREDLIVRDILQLVEAG